MVISKQVTLGLIFVVVLGLVTGCSAVRAGSNTDRTILDEHAAQIQQTAYLENENSEAATSDARAEYRWKSRPENQMAPGFEIQIVHPDDEKLNGNYRIGFDGVLKLPYDIRVQTSGLTEEQLKDRIISAYSKFFQTAPNIQVSVVDRMYWVDVRGLVLKPGQYLMRQNSSLDELIAAGGGLEKASLGEPAAKYVRIKQDDDSTYIRISDYYSGLASLEPKWQGGDVVFFQSQRGDVPAITENKEHYIHILGQVRNPGEYPYDENADFYEYLVRTGGPTEKADLDRIEIVRGQSGEGRSEMFGLAENDQLPRLSGGDLVIVHAEGTSGIEKKTRLYGSIASIVTSVATVVILALTL